MEVKVSLWNSANEERRWIESKNDYEDFRIFLKRKINECISNFKELKQLLK